MLTKVCSSFLGFKMEDATLKGEYAMKVFLDIEGPLTMHPSEKVVVHGFGESVIKWIYATLSQKDPITFPLNLNSGSSHANILCKQGFSWQSKNKIRIKLKNPYIFANILYLNANTLFNAFCITAGQTQA